MNIRNTRIQEANRIRNTVQTQMRATQTFGTSGGAVNGYRSLAFYQASRNTNSGNNMVFGNHTGGGNLVT